MTSRLWLVRHARPEVPEGICYGQTDLSAQLPTNRDAAQQLAQAITMQSNQDIWVYTSGLQRTRQLAQALQNFVPKLTIQHDVRLQEMHFGCWEMHPWNEIPKAEIDTWIDNFGEYRFGGVESCQDVLTRVIAAYQDMQSILKNSAKNDAPWSIIWITHAGVIRALSYYLATGNATIAHVDQWPKTAPGFGAWIECAIEVL